MRWWQMAGLAYGHQIRGQLGHALVRAEQVPVVTISTDEGGQFDFTRPEELIGTGRSAASSALAHGLAVNVRGPGCTACRPVSRPTTVVAATAGVTQIALP